MGESYNVFYDRLSIKIAFCVFKLSDLKLNMSLQIFFKVKCWFEYWIKGIALIHLL